MTDGGDGFDDVTQLRPSRLHVLGADHSDRGIEIGIEFHPIPTRGRGRPSLTGAARQSPQVTFRLDPATRASAAARAELEGKTVSALAREALEQYLDAS